MLTAFKKMNTDGVSGLGVIDKAGVLKGVVSASDLKVENETFLRLIFKFSIVFDWFSDQVC